MTIRRNKLTGQTNGANATAANSATSGDAWSANNLGAGSTLKYSTTSPPTGATVFVEATPASAQIANFDDTALGSVTDYEFEDTFYYSGAPTVNNTVIYQLRGSGGRCIDLAVTTAGKLGMQATAQLGSVSTNAFPTAGWYRIRFKAHCDTGTPANGTSSYAVYDAAGSAVTGMSGSATGTINNGPFTTARRGCTSTAFAVAGNWTVWRYALLQNGDVTADIGAYPTNVAPTGVIDAAQIGVNPYSTVTHSGTGSSDPDGTIASYAWTQTAGTTVTLSGAATSSVSYTAPAVAAGTTVTLQLVVTDNLGATSSPVTVTDTIVPHTIFATGGAPIKMKIV